MNKIRFSIVCLSAAGFLGAQVKDSLQSKNIDEVVITGQFSPQSINKSIYKVEVIDQQQIKNMAATTVAEVLNQNLNMLIVPDSGSGNSNANIMGLGGEYTKVLIDNIPVVNDEGLGNSFDLTKINLNNVERIEIVKGSMGVEYGNNAVTGVINIITKKGSSKKFSGNVALQEETVGENYDWYKKGNGRHIQSLNIGYNINNNWFVSADINHNDFQGFEGRHKGYKYFTEDFDFSRGYDWQPKDQINANALVKYSKNKTTLYYKISHLNEEINYRNNIYNLKTFAGGVRTYWAEDRDYFTKRWIHQFNIITKLGDINYMGDFSYQKQTREYQNYIYDIPVRQEVSREDKFRYYDTDVYYSRGMFSNFLNSEKFNFQLGYELDQTNGYSSYLTLGNNDGKDLNKDIFNYANFIAAEWAVSPLISLRPGFRLALSNKFESQYNYSFTAKFDLSSKSDLRAIVGSANRFPGYEELYTYMVDSNHDIRGNEDLRPEEGFSGGIFWDHQNNKNSKKLSFSLSAMYLQVKDRIELGIVNNSPLQYKYINIDDYKSINFTGGAQFRKNNFALNSGVSFMGISKVLNDANGAQSPDDFYFYPEVNVSANYKLSKLQTLFALYYKYSGNSRRIVMESDIAGNTTFRVGKIGDYSMMNFIISQPFLKDHLEFSLGIKNIFDVTDIRDTTQAGTAHEGAQSSRNYFYGRSYFARLIYNF